MQRSMASAGLVGLVFLFFALLAYLTGARLYCLFNLVLGVLAIVLWATSSRETFGTLMGHRATRYGANAVVYSIGFIGLLVAINYILALHHRRFDLTAERVFSLSPQSLKVVRTLKRPLKLYGFFQGGRDPRAEALYQSYTYASPKISFQLIDPEKNPEIATRYKVTRMPTTHLQYGDEGTNVGETTEQAITNGIIKVTSTGTKGACFLQGHGEPSIDDMDNAGGFGRAAQALAGENYDIKPLMLMTAPKVPADCVVVIVAGPVKPLFPAEVEALDSYLKHGGRALVMLRPPRADQPNAETSLINMVSQWGLTVGDDIVLDQELHLFAGPTLGLSPLVELYPPHPITRGFTKRTLWPMVRSVEPVKTIKAGLQAWPLAQTSDTSIAATEVEEIFKQQKFKPSAKDRKGPITVADAVDADNKKLKWGTGDGRLVVYGDTDFANNQNLSQVFNQDFFLNTVDWLAGETATIAIRPRALRASRVSLTVSQFNNVFVASVLLLPELLLILGIVVWRGRRN
jgi:gliding motility-associatede transport system auxiliary component